MTCDRSIFESRYSEYNNKLNELRIKSSRLSFIRLLSFILIAVCIICAIVKSNSALYYISFVPLVFFIFVVIKHSKINKDILFYSSLLSVTEEYLARIDCDFSKLTDFGDEFEVPSHDYSFDLDILGKNSIFSRFNVSDNYIGRSVFADKLLNGHINSLSNTELISKQKAVDELISKYDFVTSYQAISRNGYLKKKPEAILKLVDSENKYSGIDKLLFNVQVVLWLIPVVLKLIDSEFTVASVMAIMVVNLLSWFFVASKYNSVFAKSSGISKQANTLSNLYNLIDSESFDSDCINSLVGQKKEISGSLTKLSSALTLTGLRSQPFFALILNSLLPFDYWCSLRITNWIKSDATDLNKAIYNLGELESLMSAASVGLTTKYSSFPILTDNCEFVGVDIYHPLINPNDVVSNSISMSSQTAIITGSNMSGKTTLIRTVGICSVLAYIGAPVPANSVKLGHMRIMSSMRIVDSLESNMSTFRAELVKIAQIVKSANDESNLMFLIDEIFRGTNSADRTEGAYTVLRKLDKKHILGMMTTHDYALCDKVKESMQNIVYYHFSETYNDKDIIFDYKLKNGISNETNAKYLMRLVGITD